MESFGTTLGVFIGVNIVLFGWAAYMTGQALATTWRPAWQLAPYMVLLAAAERFIDYALFGGALLSLSGYILALVVLLLSTFMSYRATRARKMVNQYPWLYERSGPFAWREKQG